MRAIIAGVTPRASAGGARPEFPQRMPVALAPWDQSLRVFPALTEEGDDAVGELAEGHRVEGRGVEPVDDERAVAADRSRRSRVAPSAAGRRDATQMALAAARFLAGCWKFKGGCQRIYRRCAVRPFW